MALRPRDGSGPGRFDERLARAMRLRSARQSARHARKRERVGVADEEFGMRSEHAVGQEVSDLGLRPPMNNAVNDAMEIRAWVDIVRDARRDDREDVARARAAFVEPGEQPIFCVTEVWSRETGLALDPDRRVQDAIF